MMKIRRYLHGYFASIYKWSNNYVLKVNNLTRLEALCKSSKVKVLHSTLVLLILAFSGVIIYNRSFLNLNVISSGDIVVYYQEALAERFPYIETWEMAFNFLSYPNSGLLVSLGGFQMITLNRVPIQFMASLLASIGVSFNVLERLLFYWPFAILPQIGMYLLLQKRVNNKVAIFIGALLYSFNTYSFLMSYAGHILMGVPYALFPFILFFYIETLEENSPRKALITAFLVTICLIYDVRMTYIIFLTMLIYLAFRVLREGRIHAVKLTLLIFLITAALHSYWILPFLFCGMTDVESFLPTAPWISWTRMINSMFMFHPFWKFSEPTWFYVNPTPIYFLLLPFICFLAALLRPKDKFVLFCSVMGIIGIFLTKGENPPLGIVYQWLFYYIPGFNMFRDPMKFFVLITLSLSGLMSCSLDAISEILARLRPTRLKFLPILPTVLLLAMTIFPGMAGEIKGPFDPKGIPNEYIYLKDYINRQNEFFRVLYVPSYSRYSFSSTKHPLVYMISLSSELRRFDTVKLGRMCVKYIVLPSDQDNEIYRNYMISEDNTSITYCYFGSPSRKEDYKRIFDGFNNLERINDSQFNEIIVYENKDYFLPLIYAVAPNQVQLGIEGKDFLNVIKPVLVRPSSYVLTVNTSEPFVLILSESYNSRWNAYIGSIGFLQTFWEKPIDEKDHFMVNDYANAWYINPIRLGTSQNFTITLYFKPQSYLYIGLIISGCTFSGCVGYLIWKLKREVRKGTLR